MLQSSDALRSFNTRAFSEGLWHRPILLAEEYTHSSFILSQICTDAEIRI